MSEYNQLSPKEEWEINILENILSIKNLNDSVFNTLNTYNPNPISYKINVEPETGTTQSQDIKNNNYFPTTSKDPDSENLSLDTSTGDKLIPPTNLQYSEERLSPRINISRSNDNTIFPDVPPIEPILLPSYVAPHPPNKQGSKNSPPQLPDILSILGEAPSPNKN